MMPFHFPKYTGVKFIFNVKIIVFNFFEPKENAPHLGIFSPLLNSSYKNDFNFKLKKPFPLFKDEILTHHCQTSVLSWGQSWGIWGAQESSFSRRAHCSVPSTADGSTDSSAAENAFPTTKINKKRENLLFMQNLRSYVSKVTDSVPLAVIMSSVRERTKCCKTVVPF